VASLARADSATNLRPAADGGTEQWQNEAGTACSSATCYTEVNESSGANCTTTPGDSTDNQSTTTNNSIQQYDIDESSIPVNATVTSVTVYACAVRAGSQSVTTRLGFVVNGSVTECASTFTAGASYADASCTIDIPDDVYTAADDYEIYVQNEQARNVLVTAVKADVTYTPPAGLGRRGTGRILTILPIGLLLGTKIFRKGRQR
jgi:hypothetical protein